MQRNRISHELRFSIERGTPCRSPLLLHLLRPGIHSSMLSLSFPRCRVYLGYRGRSRLCQLFANSSLFPCLDRADKKLQRLGQTRVNLAKLGTEYCQASFSRIRFALSVLLRTVTRDRPSVELSCVQSPVHRRISEHREPIVGH